MDRTEDIQLKPVLADSRRIRSPLSKCMNMNETGVITLVTP